MRTYKKMDFKISCLLIIFFTILGLVNLDHTFIVGYLTIGAWQVISMLIHAVNSWFTEKGSIRYNYHLAVLVIFTLFCLGFFIPAILVMILYFMLLAAPVMAVYYTVLCYKEVYIKMQRPIALLK